MVLYGMRSAAGFLPDATVCTTDAEVTSPVARFKYDARNRRIARQDAATGQWTYMVSDPSGNPLSELALVGGAWTRVRDYVWLDGRPLAQVEYPGPTPQGEGYAYYFHVDHIGLPRAMTNAAGQLVWNTFPRPYGDIAEKTMTDPLLGRVVVTNLRLPGQYDERLLGSLGLQGPYYNWNRWYLPGVGRYLERDPIALFGEFNTAYGVDWYGYGLQNPLSYADPGGLLPAWLKALVLAWQSYFHTRLPPIPPYQPPPPSCPVTGPPPPPPPPPPWTVPLYPWIMLNPSLYPPEVIGPSDPYKGA
jgi:RHS repeat-associated protein